MWRFRDGDRKRVVVAAAVIAAGLTLAILGLAFYRWVIAGVFRNL